MLGTVLASLLTKTDEETPWSWIWHAGTTGILSSALATRHPSAQYRPFVDFFDNSTISLCSQRIKLFIVPSNHLGWMHCAGRAVAVNMGDTAPNWSSTLKYIAPVPLTCTVGGPLWLWGMMIIHDCLKREWLWHIGFGSVSIVKNSTKCKV